MTPSGCLLDAGPLVALLDKDDQDHERATKLFSEISSPFITCESVISEVCFLANKGDSFGPKKVILLGLKGLYQILFSLRDHQEFVHSLLEKYADQPISLADACLVRCAEIHNEPRILTFDSDFKFYRWDKSRKFQIID